MDSKWKSSVIQIAYFPEGTCSMEATIWIEILMHATYVATTGYLYMLLSLLNLT